MEEYEEKDVMVDTSEGAKQVEVINGLSPKEISELRGVLFPSAPVGDGVRIGPNGALQIQADYLSESIGYTERRLDEVNAELNKILPRHAEDEEFLTQTRRQLELEETRDSLEESIEGLREARKLVLDQKELEETREEQVEDITRLQKFKEWVKKNLSTIVGISALATSIAGLITTIVVGARKAAIKGAKGVSKFSKAVADLGKKVWP